ncbi:MAG TPA: FAD-linked oxidase C-terminal domain-containing protein [Acidobacteriota bacterium]|nr:FAD-linked oxidase C-terminal domain-containing protein [Acidobacteriota bacterium]
MNSDQRRRLVEIVGPENALTEDSELLVYERDALSFHRHTPDLVLFPRCTRHVAEIARLAYAEDIPYLPRGAGTSLSGGAVPAAGGILLETSRLNRVLEINAEERWALVEPGVVNSDLSAATKKHGLYFAPDPSSQSSCTIGGNISTNAGGPHCLKYGSTVLHVNAVETVTPQGEVAVYGSPQGFSNGLDLVGLFCGSEGTLGVMTKAWVKLLPIPQSVKTFLADFTSLKQAGDAVSEVIASGIIPAALEMLDQLTIKAVEESIFAAGYPRDAAAVLLLELDGLEAETEEDAEEIRSILARNGAREVREARNEAEREKLWQGRKKAFGAMGRIAKDLYLQDTVVPRTRLSEVLEKIYAIAERHGLALVNVFHAGDGNLHPVLLYDGSNQEHLEKVMEASREMVEVSIEAGGTLTGEHGVGLEKRDFMPYIFSDDDLDIMRRIRNLFDPKLLCNPQKVLPTTKVCQEFRERGRACPPQPTQEPAG